MNRRDFNATLAAGMEGSSVRKHEIMSAYGRGELSLTEAVNQVSAIRPPTPLWLGVLRLLVAWMALLFLCCAASACDLQIVHGVPVYGTQVCNPSPEFTGDANETVVVPSGQTLHLMQQTEQTALDVLVKGTLVVEGRLHVRTLTAWGGTILLKDGAEIVIRDLPIDKTLDPSEWGHGILVIDGGQLLAETDNWRQGSVRSKASINRGDRTLYVADPPHGWSPGDTLILHDTRQPATGVDISSQTELAFIDRVESTPEGCTVWLKSQLQFDHWSAHGLFPKLACLTQPITIRSENPAGVRGHVAAVGHSAMYLCGVQAIGMGRTRAVEKLSSTNQVGRYSLGHFHHYCGLMGETREWQGETIHCSVWDSPKWGWSIHNAYWVNVEDCVGFNCLGGAFITEQVLSYGFRLKDNYACGKDPGSGQRITDRSTRNDSGPLADHWHDRVGFGLGSAMGEITGNYAACCKESYGMAGFGASVLYYPTKRGVMLSGKTDPNAKTLGSHMGYIPGEPRRYPFVFPTNDNIAWGGWRGYETWSVHSYLDYEHEFPGLTLVHCKQPTDIQDHDESVFRRWRILGDYNSPAPTGSGGNSTFALNFKDGYRFGITAIDCEFKGHGAAYRIVNDGEHTRFINCTFDCPVICYMPQGRMVGYAGPWVGEWTDCTFLNNPLFADGWFSKYPLDSLLAPGRADRKALPHVRYYIRPWHDGKDYQVYHYEQHPTWQHAKGPPAAGQPYGDLPEGVWTQQQLIELGTPIFGDSVPDHAVKWGKFYATEEDCCIVAERLRARIKELEGN
jgi:nitrogen fixation protein